MLQIFTIAKKEYADAFKNKVFLAFLLFLLFLIGVSIVIGALDFQSKVAVYRSALQQLRQSGQPVSRLAKPQFYPLQLLRGSIEYLEIIGAILAVVVGYLSIAKEKGNNTLQLILTRPIGRVSFIMGKIAGNTILLASAAAIAFLGIYAAVELIGGVQLTGLETTKLFLSFIFSSLYLLIFFCLSATFTLLFRSPTNALIVAFVIWLLFVLIIPQIGDTMDPDNQVPGGLFNSLHMAKPQEQAVLKQFTGYESTRNALEESSVTKHYERLTFALLGIKDLYNEKSLPVIFHDKFADTIWVFSFLVFFGGASILVFMRKQSLW